MAVMKQVVLSLSQRESSGKHPKQNPIKLERLSHATDGPVDTTDKSHAEQRSRDPKPTVFVSASKFSSATSGTETVRP